MKRSFKNRRGFLHSNIHAIAVGLFGKDEAADAIKIAVDTTLRNRSQHCLIPDQVSIKDLSDDEAEQMYRDFRRLYAKSREDSSAVKRITEPGNISTKNQEGLIRKLSMKFGWSQKGLFDFLIETAKDVGSRLNKSDLQRKDLQSLFLKLNKKEADHCIKRLIQIEKKKGGLK